MALRDRILRKARDGGLATRIHEVKRFLNGLLFNRAPAVAGAMDIDPAKLRKYYEGSRHLHFPAALVKPLFRATGYDRKVADFFLLEGTPYRLVKIEQGDELADASPENISRMLLSIGLLKGRINSLYLSATAHDSEAGVDIGPGEARDLSDALADLIRLAEDLRMALRRQHSAI